MSHFFKKPCVKCDGRGEDCSLTCFSCHGSGVVDILKYEDVTESDLYTIESMIGMGRGAWDMVDHKELMIACVKAFFLKESKNVRN